MGIKGLMKLISDEVPSCVREISMSQLSGRTVAIDASMALYQFLSNTRTISLPSSFSSSFSRLVAIRSNDGSGPSAMLTNSEGETTSHIQGTLLPSQVASSVHVFSSLELLVLTSCALCVT